MRWRCGQWLHGEHPVMDSIIYVSCRAQAGRAGAGGAGRPGGGPGVVADGVGEEGGGEARCARQGPTAATRGVPRRHSAVVHLPLHGMRRGALRARV